MPVIPTNNNPKLKYFIFILILLISSKFIIFNEIHKMLNVLLFIFSGKKNKINNNNIINKGF